MKQLSLQNLKPLLHQSSKLHIKSLLTERPVNHIVLLLHRTIKRMTVVGGISLLATFFMVTTYTVR
jgi:hypothetical protein